MEFDKARVRQLYEEMLTRLGIPLEPEKASMENSFEVLFLAHVSQAVLQANNVDITIERRKQMLLEIIRMDESITTESMELASKINKAQYN